jgi:putative Mg2+ transporter-C (MgtC) family protein
MLEHALRLAAAYLLALPLAWNREKGGQGAGLRTFPLVAIASCSFLLLAQRLPVPSAEAQARILQGLITGIGFIGGGTILKNREQVSGLATATCIWVTGALGAACAYGYFELAAAISLASYLTLRLMKPVKEVAQTCD